ncbi:MAG: nucleotidyltransferase domain-containing protein [Natronosporangium sp.]
MALIPDQAEVTSGLRLAGARFAFVHGSRAEGNARSDSDLDLAAWWGGDAPHSWEVALPAGVDLVVLDRAPLWLAGRIALAGRLLFDDAPPERVRWQADTRRIWLDERPYLLQRQREWRRAVLARGR